ncbi:chitin synthase-domain-containing protein, partial [Globomyces pollinis-pini]
MTEKPSGQSVFSDSQSDWWSQLSSAITICCIPGLLERFNIKGANVQQAWREKITLCVIIGLIMLLVAYFTLGLKSTLCWDSGETNPFFNPGTSVIPWRSTSLVRGQEYNFTTMQQFLSQQNPAVNLTADWYGVDIARLFKPNSDACDSFVVDPKKICTIPNKLPGSPSLSTNECIGYKSLQSIPSVNRLTFDWVDVSSNFQPPHTLVIFNGAVLNLTDFFRIEKDRDYRNIPALDKLIPGNDVTLGMSSSSDKAQFMYCLASRYTVGIIGVESAGCAVYNSLMIIALLTILGIILARFIMALVFHWMIAPSISRSISTRLGRNDIGYLNPTVRNLYLTQRNEQNNNGPLINQTWARSLALPTDLFTILLVTCYSENKQGIKGTLDSLAATDYPDDRKLLFVICDGLIQGAGNTETTPDIVISLIEQDDTLPIDTKSYLAIADGVKQHNMAKVYAGRYMYQQRPVPIIVVVKCGNEDERRAVPQDKPGNRGKRDSQLLLFNFLSRVTYNDRMTALDYDLFWKIQKITGGVTPDFYQLLLMIDADTIVQPDSLRYMVQTMVNDPGVIGLCGETRVENKMESWVTMIQVYEYFTNHNLGKSFESVFGGVTCLPGCFCMYRIKSPAGSHCIPFLVSPDIVEAYSENIVDTLHKKNLLLLGEDRFLSTLMLGTFPNRKMVFVPQAICHTTVPHTYQMLQSQRRRWINSTIHNLLELVKLPNLCGTFCFSMQFVIAMELLGTVSLPAAVLLTFYLIIGAIFSANTPIIPLVILMITLFLPGVLVLMTTRKPQYVLWMFVYLLAIPIWNFMLPLYAFWNFDDFSWGDTRKVEGEDKTKDHSTKDGDYIIGSVVLKKWEEWELERRQL